MGATASVEREQSTMRALLIVFSCCAYYAASSPVPIPELATDPTLFPVVGITQVGATPQVAATPQVRTLRFGGDTSHVSPERLRAVEAWMNTVHPTNHADVVPNSLAYNWNHPNIESMIPDLSAGSIFLKLTTTTPAFVVALPGYETDYIAKTIAESGNWERELQNFYAYITGEGSICTPNTILVDAGANIGFFSGYFTSTGCKVYSIELQARMSNWNLATMKLNEKWPGQITHY